MKNLLLLLALIFSLNSFGAGEAVFLTDGVNLVKAGATPGVAGNVLNSDGTDWVSSPISGGSIVNIPAGNIIATTIQGAINELDAEKQALDEKGQANGYAELDGAGKVPIAQLPNSIMEFQGVWNATTNSPVLVDGVGNTGDVYRVDVSGNQDLGSGSQSFLVGDWVMYDAGGVWRLAHAGSDLVQSVNGYAGVVVLDKTDIGLSNVDNVQQIPMSYLDIDGTLAADSDVKVASQKATKTYADAKVADAIADGVLTIAPSQNAVFDALALKENLLINSAGLAAALTDETGTGFAVFSADPALTGSPTAPTQTANDNSTKLATTAYVDSAITAGSGIDSLNGLIASTQLFANGAAGLAPAFSSLVDTHTLDIPLAAGAGVTSGTISKVEYDIFNGKQNALVDSAGLAAALSDETGTGFAVFSADAALTGSPTAPTQTADDNSTKLATTAYADAKVADAIVDAVTSIAPSQNAVFDALALKSVAPTVSAQAVDFTAAYNFIYVVSGTVNVQLPAPVNNGIIYVKKTGSNSVTLVRNGSEQIDGVAASRSLSSDKEAVMIVSDGTNWFLI